MSVSIAAFDRGGTAYAQATAIASVVEAGGSDAASALGEVRVLETLADSVGSVVRMESGEADFGFAAANLLGRAVRGETPFAAPVGIRTVAPVHVGPMFFVVPARSGLQYVGELRGKRIAVGVHGAGVPELVVTIMRALGWPQSGGFEPLHLDFSEGAEALIAGRTDALVCPAPPNRALASLAEAIDLRVIDYGPGQLGLILAAQPLFRRFVMRKGAIHGLAHHTEQVGVLTLIAAHERAPDEQVGALVELLARNTVEFARQTPLFADLPAQLLAFKRYGPDALDIDGASLHPAAAAAYRRLGLLSD